MIALTSGKRKRTRANNLQGNTTAKQDIDIKLQYDLRLLNFSTTDTLDRPKCGQHTEHCQDSEMNKKSIEL